MFDDLDGVEVMVDDILVWGATQKEHDKRLEKVLQRAEKRNLKLNKDKSQISMPAIHYLGHVLTKEGIKPDPKKVTAIVKMDQPKGKDDLHRFMGMVTYLSKFIPNYSEVSSPL